MYVFLKSISLYGVNDLLHVVNASVETKNHLKQLIEKGIKDKIVCRLSEETSKTVSQSNE